MWKTHGEWAGRVSELQLIFLDMYAINSNSILICMYILAVCVRYNGYDVAICIYVLICLNIRSLPKNFDELFILFDEYDIILLSETWLNRSFDSSLIKRDGFVLFRQDRDQKIRKRGGGLAAYIKSDIALYCMHALYGLE